MVPNRAGPGQATSIANGGLASICGTDRKRRKLIERKVRVGAAVRLCRFARGTFVS